jgi:glucokinase
LTNDANAAAIGEMIFGAAKGLHDFIIITLGTGLGSGIVANGELIYGHDGFAGELGHTTAIRNGRLCGCGRKGCLETYASATGIVRTVKEWMNNGEESSLSKIQSDKITAWNVYEAAMQNDALAKKAFLFTTEILGQTLADAVAYTSPSAIILFGGLAKSGDLLLQPLKHFMEENLLKIYKNKVNILLSNLPESDAAVLGAAALIWKESKNIFQTI